MIGGDWHLYPTRRQHGYLQRFSDRLGAAVTWRGRGAQSGEKGKHDHEGWRVCHYDATARGGRSAEIDGERSAGHYINTNRGGFASRSACPFLAPFSSVFHTSELGPCLKINNLGNRKYVFFSRIIYSIYKRYLESRENCLYGRRVELHKLVITRDDLHQ